MPYHNFDYLYLATDQMTLALTTTLALAGIISLLLMQRASGRFYYGGSIPVCTGRGCKSKTPFALKPSTNFEKAATFGAGEYIGSKISAKV